MPAGCRYPTSDERGGTRPEHILADILGAMPIAKQQTRRPDDVVTVRIHKRTKRLAIAVAQPARTNA
ncbi:hypothetical protein J6TS7_18630 [Paenibacillus dendritiformis]|nr:hypothetical protein J6TS7_18630 [Paenibacillus dendritiformis]